MTSETRRHVKALTFLFDESTLRGGSIILRGVLDPKTLNALLVDTYQREAGSLASLSSLLGAYSNSQPVPDIELGMRGQKYKENADGTITLMDDIYMIDGLQRVTAARHHLRSNPDADLRIGFTLHFQTDREWEAERFEIMNTRRSKVAPNILLREKKETSRVAAMLYGVSKNERDSALHDRVSWSQKMQKGELITAMTFAKTVGQLHGHVAAARYSGYQELVPALDNVADITGLQAMRENVRVFFDILDQSWGIRTVTYRDGATHLRGTFLMTLARIFSDHPDFWKENGKRLFLDADMRRKLASFNIRDPKVKDLAASSGKSRDILYSLIVDHLNSGKRGKRLVKRDQIGFQKGTKARHDEIRMAMAA